MVSALIVLASFGLLAFGFWLLVKRAAHGEISFWNVLAIVFVAKSAAKLASKAMVSADWPVKLSVSMLCYVLIMSLGLSTLGKVRAVPALLLSIGFAIVAMVLGVLVVSTLPVTSGTKPTP